MNDEPYMAATLSAGDRDRAEKLITAMLHSLRESEKYLSDYLSGRVNAAKAYGVVDLTAGHIQESMQQILRMHQNQDSSAGQ